jgi:hypothetical protein
MDQIMIVIEPTDNKDELTSLAGKLYIMRNRVLEEMKPFSQRQE